MVDGLFHRRFRDLRFLWDEAELQRDHANPAGNDPDGVDSAVQLHNRIKAGGRDLKDTDTLRPRDHEHKPADWLAEFLLRERALLAQAWHVEHIANIEPEALLLDEFPPGRGKRLAP